MKLFKTILLLFLAFILALLDTSYFSMMPFYGATFLSTYSIIIIFALMEKVESFLIFALSSLIFFTIFSSLPVWLLFITVFLVPSLILAVRKVYLEEPPPQVSILFFILANFIFESVLVIYSKEWNTNGFNVLGSYILLNSVLGVAIFSLIKIVERKYFVSKTRIK